MRFADKTKFFIQSMHVLFFHISKVAVFIIEIETCQIDHK